jgi:hypothetical protein
MRNFSHKLWKRDLSTHVREDNINMGLIQIRCEHQDWIQIAENTPLKALNLIIFTYNLLSVFIFGVLQTQLRSPLSSYWHFPTVHKQNKIMHFVHVLWTHCNKTIICPVINSNKLGSDFFWCKFHKKKLTLIKYCFIIPTSVGSITGI